MGPARLAILARTGIVGALAAAGWTVGYTHARTHTLSLQSLNLVLVGLVQNGTGTGGFQWQDTLTCAHDVTEQNPKANLRNVCLN
jgi:hypothetical protein